MGQGGSMNLKQLYERAKKNNSYYAKETFEDFIHDYKNVREDFFVSEEEYRRLAPKLEGEFYSYYKKIYGVGYLND